MDITEINNIDSLTLDYIKQYLRIDHNLDDLELSVYITSAKSYVKKYVNEEFINEPELIMPVLMLVSHFYEHKTPVSNTNETYDFIFKDILWMCRGVSL